MPSPTPTKATTPIAATRITYTTTTPFATVAARLDASINANPPNKPWPPVVGPVMQNPNTTRAEKLSQFEALVNERIGPHGFMQFFEINHSGWLGAFYPSTVATASGGRTLQVQRVILGNPLIAITMLRHDLDAGLYAPTELLLVEEEGGGVRCVYLLPSGLVAGYEGATAALREAAEGLDAKLAALVEEIMA